MPQDVNSELIKQLSVLDKQITEVEEQALTASTEKREKLWGEKDKILEQQKKLLHRLAEIPQEYPDWIKVLFEHYKMDYVDTPIEEAYLLEPNAMAIPEESVVNTFVNIDDNEIITSLIDRATYLVEGPRGSGKTTYLKYAKSKLDKSFKESNIIGVYVSFDESILFAGVTAKSEFNAFKQWVFVVLIKGLLDAAKNLRPDIYNSVKGDFIDVFERPKTIKLFKKTILQLENKLVDYIEFLRGMFGMSSDDDLVKIAKETIGFSDNASVLRLQTPDYFGEFIMKVLNKLEAERVIFFLDEAGHNFSAWQQEIFFGLLRTIKSQHHIAWKVAVYPAVQKYGSTFHPAQDAQVLSLRRDVFNLNLINKFREISYKRSTPQILREFEPYLDFIIIASFGNPRSLIRMLARINSFYKNTTTDVNTFQIVQTIIDYETNNVINHLKHSATMLKRFTNLTTDAEKFLLEFLLPSLSEVNARNAIPTISYFILPETPEEVRGCTKLLQYAGIVQFEEDTLINPGKKSVKSGSRFSTHLGLLLSRGGLGVELAEDKMEEIKKQMSNIASTVWIGPILEDDIKNLNLHLTEAHELLLCPKCQMPRDNSQSKFCSNCGTEFNIVQTEVNEFLSKSVDILTMPYYHHPNYVKKLLKKNGVTCLKDIVTRSPEQLQKIPGIGPVRSHSVRGAAFDLITG